MILEILPGAFSLCSLQNLDAFLLSAPFTFAAWTDKEYSLVCPTALAPNAYLQREDGFRGIRVQGQLDLSLVGVLSKLSSILAEAKIPLFCISTFQTDYLFLRQETFSDALTCLAQAGFPAQPL